MQINFDLINSIRNNVKEYIVQNNIKSLIIGISGGIDSTVNAAILKPICKELNIPLIGRYIHIESNKKIEEESARLVGKAFCTQFEVVDLTLPFNHFLTYSSSKNDDLNSIEFKIRKGNIKARMRMMFLRDLTQKHKGLMVDNSNFTEYNLGFFTVSDNGDISPMQLLWKTEVYEIAKLLANNSNSEEKKALEFSISLVPTDGLGISNSDLEQIGAKTYNDVDDILQSFIQFEEDNVKKMLNEELADDLIIKAFNDKCRIYTEDVVINVLKRWINSKYKRNNLPIVVNIN
ncbi:MAG: NAD(+) synthase [Bacilli bacterium]|nr:NAD(+) synthase [Bacilli bacterium]